MKELGKEILGETVGTGLGAWLFESIKRHVPDAIKEKIRRLEIDMPARRAILLQTMTSMPTKDVSNIDRWLKDASLKGTEDRLVDSLVALIIDPTRLLEFEREGEHGHDEEHHAKSHPKRGLHYVIHDDATKRLKTLNDLPEEIALQRLEIARNNWVEQLTQRLSAPLKSTLREATNFLRERRLRRERR